MVQTLEAQSDDKFHSKEDVLRKIVAQHYSYVLYHKYLDREAVMGVIGDRGGGKSASTAMWAFINFMMDGKTVWSNMEIKFGFMLRDEYVEEATGGLLKKGGFVFYRSEPLDKVSLLHLDETYRDGCLAIEEINVQYSNARRFMTNTNVDFNEVCQQLRKFNTSLAYNVIDEMFIDVQLRSLTDFFIKSYDTAFEIENMARQKPKGNDFSWRIYPLTGYLAGEESKYSITKKPLPPANFHFTQLQGLFDSTRWQEKGVYSQSRTESSKEMSEYMNKWSWLGEKAKSIKKAGYDFLRPHELSQQIGQPLTDAIKKELKRWGIYYDPHQQGYSIDTFDLETETPDEKAFINIT